MNTVYVYDHLRTPRGRGRPDGALHEVPPVHLAAGLLASLRARNGFPGEAIDDVGLGIVMPVGEQGADLTRTALLAAGYGDSVTGYQVNRFCTSGLDTVKFGHALIASGQADAVIGGGVESMSRVPIGADGGAAYVDPRIGLTHPYIPNGVAADLMATLHGITRDDVDAYAVESQRRAAEAAADGRFARSLDPVKDVIGQTLLTHDEAGRPGTTLADLAKLKPAFAGLGAEGFDRIVLQRYPSLRAIEHVHTGEGRLELGEVGAGGAGPHGLVMGEQGLADDVLHRVDRLREPPAGRRLGRTALALDCVGVHVVTREAVQRGHQVGRDTVRNVGMGHADARIHVRRAAIGADGHPRHRLDPAADHRVRLP